MRFAKPVAPETSGNIAPLLDVVLLLLIFFMVTTSFSNQQIRLDLPQTESGAVQPAEFVVVSIDEQGVYSVDDERVDDGALGALLQTLARQERNLEIRADAATRHEYVVRILDLARTVNLGQVGIAVEAGRLSLE